MFFYVILLSLSIFKVPRESPDGIYDSVRTFISTQWDSAVKDFDKLQPMFGRGSTNYPLASNRLSALQSMTLSLSAIVHGTLALTTFTVLQAFAIWCYADGYEPIQVLWYSYEVAKQTTALFKLKRWNRELIQVSESTWGFGQCLSLVMLGAMLFTVYMTFHEKHLKTVKIQ
jgi:hypothetical protein